MAETRFSSCRRCGDTLTVSGRGRTPTYCSTRCRVAAHRAERAPKSLPRELTARTRWVRRSEDKVPLQTSGRAASSTDRDTWVSYSEARASAKGVGLGYVLAEGDGIVCIDLDHCLDGDTLAPWARKILRRCPDTYTEVSVSGTGLHIFGRGTVSQGRRVRKDGAAVEVYGAGRYIAITGDRFEDAPTRLADLSTVLPTLA